MTSADLIVRGCRELLTCRGPLPKRKEGLGDVGLVPDGWIASDRGRIVFVGPEAEFLKTVRPRAEAVWVEGGSSVALPGFVDAHTHLPFAGSRENEFKLRLQGWSYQRLAAEGMGIQSTVRATRAATRDELKALCLERLDEMLLAGTTTVEAKSGYGLNLEDEIKQLEVLHDLRGAHPVEVIPTFMGAHEVPPEYRGRKDDYLRLLIQTVLPEVRKRNLAEFVDVFCEEGVFSLEDTRRLAEAADKAEFKLKVHADEFVSLGGAELAAALGAVSAEHLIAISEDGVRALAASRTAAVLLPGVPFFLMLDKRAPARRLIQAGAAVALATDYNPGSSHLSSMLFALQLGVYTMKMTVEEALNAATGNAAYAVGRHEAVGSLEVGKQMDLILCRAPSYPSLVYKLGTNPVRLVIKNGRVVARDGRRAA